MNLPRSNTVRILLTLLGFLFASIGIIGILFPVLPTTPWLLLAAACWMRSSTRFYDWLMNHRILGSYLRNYREHRGITARHRLVTLAFLWAGISISALFLVSRLWLSVLLFAIAVGVTIHLVSLKTIRAEAEGE
jgi:uncharacterized protein